MHQAKEITKMVYNNNIMNSMKLWNRMDATFMNSEHNKTTDTQMLLLNLLNQINLMRTDKYVALSNLNMYYT